jgi:hypothetical protein
MQSIVLALTLTACGPKEALPAPAAEAPPPVEEAPAPAVVEPPPPPPEVLNADFTVSMTAADGSQVSGHVKRVERGESTYGESWTTEEKNLKFYVEGNGEYKKITWTDVKRISISVPNVKDFDCLYSSEYSPWMYECSVKLKSTVTTKDGKSYIADSGHKWKFVTDDDAEHTFWLKKHYARKQDEKVVDLEVTDPQNYTLYGELQTQLRAEMKGLLTKSISVQ